MRNSYFENKIHPSYKSSFTKLHQLTLNKALKTWVKTFALKILPLSSKIIKKHVKGSLIVRQRM